MAESETSRRERVAFRAGVAGDANLTWTAEVLARLGLESRGISVAARDSTRRKLSACTSHAGYPLARREDAEARARMERARSLDPLDAMHHALSAQVAFVARDFQSALEHARQSSIILPDFWIGHYQAAQAALQVHVR